MGNTIRVGISQRRKRGVGTTTSGSRVGVAGDGYTQTESDTPAPLAVRGILFLMIAVGA